MNLSYGINLLAAETGETIDRVFEAWKAYRDGAEEPTWAEFAKRWKREDTTGKTPDDYLNLALGHAVDALARLADALASCRRLNDPRQNSTRLLHARKLLAWVVCEIDNGK